MRNPYQQWPQFRSPGAPKQKTSECQSCRWPERKRLSSHPLVFLQHFFFCLKRERRRSVTCVQVLPTITPTSAVGFFHAHDMRQPVVSLRTANTSRSTSWGWEEISPFTSHDNPFKKEKSRNLRSWLLAAGDIFSSQQFERNYQNQCKKP